MDKIYGVYHRYDTEDWTEECEWVQRRADLLFVSTDYDFCKAYAEKYSNPRKYGEAYGKRDYVNENGEVLIEKGYNIVLFAGEIVVKELPSIDDINIDPNKLDKDNQYLYYQEYCDNYANL